LRRTTPGPCRHHGPEVLPRSAAGAALSQRQSQRL